MSSTKPTPAAAQTVGPPSIGSSAGALAAWRVPAAEAAGFEVRDAWTVGFIGRAAVALELLRWAV